MKTPYARIKDIPAAPAYLVFHDGFDGAMEIWPCPGLVTAEHEARKRQERLEAPGYDHCGVWRAYTKLPRKPVYKYHYQYPKGVTA